MIVVFGVIRANMHVQWRECCRVVSAGVDHEDELQLLQSIFLGPTIGFSIHLSGSSGSYQVNKVPGCPVDCKDNLMLV